MTPADFAAETAPADVMAEIVRLRSLAAERDDLRAALRRHVHAFTDHRGTEVCGGCLADAPCPDAGLIREPQERSDEKEPMP